MQYDVQTPEDYLSQLDEDWRKERLIAIRKIILNYDKALSESIQYKMLKYGNDDDAVFHLNAQKNYVSLYAGSIDKIENGRELLADFDLGKGCIRIKKNADIDKGNLERFIHATIDKWRAGGDVAC